MEKQGGVYEDRHSRTARRGNRRAPCPWERRLRLALGRFGSRILQVTVCLADLNGPRGNTDKQCRIAVALPSCGHIRTEVLNTDLYFAIDCAADRIGRAVVCDLERQHEHSLRMLVVSRIPAAVLFRRQGHISSEERVAK